MNRRVFQAFDLSESFRDGGKGTSVFRIIDYEGGEVLDEAIWKKGRMACDFLKSGGLDVFDPEVIADWRRFAFGDFSRDFIDNLQEFSKSPNFHFEGGSREEFFEVWNEYDFVARIRCALEFFDQAPLHEMPGDRESVKGLFLALSALAVLHGIDSAVVSEFFDGDGLSGHVADIQWFSDRINPPQHVLNLLDEAKKIGRLEVSRAGQDRRHAENRAMKYQVFLHLDREFQNYRSMDQAAEAIAGKLVPVTFRTVRAWIADWKKRRSAGRP